MNLKRYFDRVVLINLQRRPDKLAQVRRALREIDWPFKRPEVFEAIDGQTVPAPAGWTHGAGAWGAMLSHRAVLEAAIRDEVGRLLVLEDDVCFVPDFCKRIEAFLRAVPEDWDQLMIGGQHINQLGRPVRIKRGVLRCTDCERMHCFAIRGTFLPRLHERLLGGGKFDGLAHCDWIMGRDPELQFRHKVYAPKSFLAGQERGQSDIANVATPRKFWNPPGPSLPVINLHAPPSVAFALHEQGFFWRHVCGHKDGRNRTLGHVFTDTENTAARVAALRDWIKAMQWEVAADPAFLCTIWHPQATPELVQAASLWKVYEITAGSVAEAVQQLPDQLRDALALR